MQLKALFFPETARYINSFLAYWTVENFVYYMFSGSTFYCHKEDDRNAYKIVLGNMVTQGMCTISELHNALGEPRRNIERFAKAYREQGVSYFFNRPDARGQCYKLTPVLLSQIQSQLDKGHSMYRISKDCKISPSSITYHIVKKGTLRLRSSQTVDSDESTYGTTPLDRAKSDHSASDGAGTAVTFQEERLRNSLGLSCISPIHFQASQSINFGGVMLLLPFLLECGLRTYRDHYQQRTSGFYDFDSLFITMAFMYLCRIKSFESIKRESSPGDWGKLIGYDRIPEVKKLRGLTKEVTQQEKCSEWSAGLAQKWISEDSPELFYVDGHLQVYYGQLANPGLKHSSRQRLCLPGMMEFWVNSSTGMPFFFVTAQVNEKMIEMLSDPIITELLRYHPLTDDLKEKMEKNPLHPRLTLVFDREAYSPEFFAQLWKERIAVITYRKNVKNKWKPELFKEEDVATSLGDVKMLLHEQELVVKYKEKPAPTEEKAMTDTENHTEIEHAEPSDKKDENPKCEKLTLREVRKLCTDEHQTSIVTTNRVLSLEQIASYMFSR